MTSEYKPPRNAVVDLFAAVPRELRPVMEVELKKIEATEDDAEWPDVPYHYGMGRIMAYEKWLEQLTDFEQKREIEACRGRYEAHYHGIAELLVEKMNELGHDMEPYKMAIAPKTSKELETLLWYKRFSRKPARPERENVYDYGRERELER